MERGQASSRRETGETFDSIGAAVRVYKKDRWGWEEGARAVGDRWDGMEDWNRGPPCSFCSGGRVEMTHGWVAVGSRFSESLERTRGKWEEGRGEKAAVNSYPRSARSWQIRGRRGMGPCG